MANASAVAAAPPPPPRSEADHEFRRGLRISFGLHAGFAIILVLKSLVFPSKPMVFIPSLRVDLVGLPDMLKTEKGKLPKMSEDLSDALKKAEREAKNIKIPDVKTPVEKAAPDEMVTKPKKQKEEATSAQTSKDRSKKMQSSLARLKALQRLQDENAPDVPIKGNVVSKGTSLDGDARETAEAGYFDALHARLKDSWNLPPWLQRQKLTAQVEVYIDASGRLQDIRFVKPSGNQQFDEAVKKSLQEAAPFPKPPKELARALMSDGILLGFPL